MNIKNRTVYCNDNLTILKGINNDTVDLIYLDPPFNSGRDYVGGRKSMAKNAEFKDSWDENDMNIEWWFDIKKKHPKLYLYLKDVDDYSRQSNQTYLVMMAVRVLEMHRILKPTGSLFYHCDHSMSHYVKIMLDIIFGLDNFKNNIVWCYTSGGASKKQFSKKHDDIFFYTKSNKFKFNHTSKGAREPFGETSIKMHFNKIDENGRNYRKVGKSIYYADEGRIRTDWWTDIKSQDASSPLSNEYTGYPTQKPLSLLERIIDVASNEGDMVLDPFCGCATACVAAEKLNRQWVGIDLWSEAHEIIGTRLDKEIGQLFIDFIVHKLEKAPKRTDNDPKYIDKKKRKYVSDEIKEAVYERDNGSCKNCGAKEELQYDHIIPFSRGGNDTIDNLQILCRSCNLTKSNKYNS